MPPKSAEKKDPRAWDALTPPLAEWILDAISSIGFTRMTPVQASTIPCLTGNKDVVVEVRPIFPAPELLTKVSPGCDRKRQDTCLSYTSC